MKCLNDAQIQAAVDNEATPDTQQHVASCARCGDKVRERQRLTAAIVSTLKAPMHIPSEVAQRVDRALADRSTGGATRLRELAPTPGRWRTAVWSGGAVAAATMIAVMVVAPSLRGPSTVSAAEILAKSADRLAERVTSGVEFLEYDLTLDGVPREMMPDYVDGAYEVTQIIDHDSPGRYLAAAYAKGGELVWGVAQDPAQRRRVLAIRVDDRLYRFEFSLAGDISLSPPEMERLHMEASVAMMQASGNQLLRDRREWFGTTVPHRSAQRRWRDAERRLGSVACQGRHRRQRLPRRRARGEGHVSQAALQRVVPSEAARDCRADHGAAWRVRAARRSVGHRPAGRRIGRPGARCAHARDARGEPAAAER